jgi:DNA-binding IclR family transcriptional regulator
LEPGQIEGLLRGSEDGLSLVALARRVGVSEANVSERLGSLERSGEVRRSGPRRTSLWRVVTDEERIAERAAELARASQSKT